ncbi:hypothetical protein AGMMS49928_09200 [Spirochaetia bacterium]|nr:hypothetical protein AGMMS49928_09200 [Spirochaetia bacterium]
MKNKLTWLFGVLVLLSLTITGCTNPAGGDDPTPSDDATLTGITVKGVNFSDAATLGTPASAITGMANLASFSGTTGSVEIPSTRANETGNGYPTTVTKGNSKAQVRIVKFSSGDSSVGDGFNAATAYNNNDAITNGDFFVIRVTAEDGTTVKYYVIKVIVVAPWGPYTLTADSVDGEIDISKVKFYLTSSPTPPISLTVSTTYADAVAAFGTAITTISQDDVQGGGKYLYAIEYSAIEGGAVVQFGVSGKIITKADAEAANVFLNPAPSYSFTAGNVEGVSNFFNVKFYINASDLELATLHKSITLEMVDTNFGPAVTGLTSDDLTSGQYLYALEFTGNTATSTVIKAGVYTIPNTMPAEGAPLITITGVPEWFVYLDADSIAGETDFDKITFFLSIYDDLADNLPLGIAYSDAAAEFNSAAQLEGGNKITYALVDEGEGAYLYALEFIGIGSGTLSKLAVPTLITNFTQASGKDIITLTSAPAYSFTAANVEGYTTSANVKFWIKPNNTSLDGFHDGFTLEDVKSALDPGVITIAPADVGAGKYLYALEFTGTGNTDTLVRAGCSPLPKVPLLNASLVSLSTVNPWEYALTADSVSGEGTFANVFFFLADTKTAGDGLSQSATLGGVPSYLGPRLDHNEIVKNDVAGGGKYLYALEFTGTSDADTLLKIGVSALPITTYAEASDTNIVTLSDAPWKVPGTGSLGSGQINDLPVPPGILVFYVSGYTTDSFTTATTRAEVEAYLMASEVTYFTNADAGSRLWAVLYNSDGPTATVLCRGCTPSAISENYDAALLQKARLLPVNAPVASAAVAGGGTMTLEGKYNGLHGSGGEITTPLTFTINLTNATVISYKDLEDEDISGWFNPAIEGLNYTGNAAAGSTSIAVTIDGAPTTGGTSSTITIPTTAPVTGYGGILLDQPLAVTGGTVNYNLSQAAWEVGSTYLKTKATLHSGSQYAASFYMSTDGTLLNGVFLDGSETLSAFAATLKARGDTASAPVTQVLDIVFLDLGRPITASDLVGGIYIYALEENTNAAGGYGRVVYFRVSPKIETFADLAALSIDFTN